MRPYRADLSMRRLCQQRAFRPVSRPLSAVAAPSFTPASLRHRSTEQPPSSPDSNRISRWNRDNDAEAKPTKGPIDPVGRNPLDYIDVKKRRVRNNAYWRRRMDLALMGLALFVGVQTIVVWTFNPGQTASGSERLDARPPRPGEASLAGADGVQIAGVKPGPDEIKLDGEGNELAPTGSDVIPFIPKTIRLPAALGGALPAPDTTPALPATTATSEDEEYMLLGHGLRYVSFLNLKVYVLGIYIRTADIPALHQAFVRAVSDAPAATALLPGEKAAMRAQLLDGAGSRALWDRVLRNAAVRMAVRVVPVRKTDFNHMRDGWVRGIAARTTDAARAAAKEGGASEYDDAGFATVMADFKALFGGRGSLAVGSEVLLLRDERGALAVSSKKAPASKELARDVPRVEFGRVEDERLSRLVWQCYLAGPSVSSEEARKSTADGIMQVVERPVGTVGVAAA